MSSKQSRFAAAAIFTYVLEFYLYLFNCIWKFITKHFISHHFKFLYWLKLDYRLFTIVACIVQVDIKYSFACVLFLVLLIIHIIRILMKSLYSDIIVASFWNWRYSFEWVRCNNIFIGFHEPIDKTIILFSFVRLSYLHLKLTLKSQFSNLYNIHFSNRRVEIYIASSRYGRLLEEILKWWF